MGLNVISHDRFDISISVIGNQGFRVDIHGFLQVIGYLADFLADTVTQFSVNRITFGNNLLVIFQPFKNSKTGRVGIGKETILFNHINQIPDGLVQVVAIADFKGLPIFIGFGYLNRRIDQG